MKLVKYMKRKNNLTVSIDETCILSILVCIAFTGILPQTILSILVLGFICILSFRNDLYLVYPIMIFYYAPLGIVFGVSVYRLYTIIFIVMTLIRFKDKLYFSKRFLAPMLIFTLYNVLVMSQYSIQTAFFSLFDIICIIFIINFYLKNYDNLKAFFRIYVVAALFSFVTGIITNNVNSTGWNFSGQFVEISRFQATFEDANYMGFFFIIAIVGLLTLELFNKKVRVILLVVLTGMILTTLSMTAIIANIIVWSLYLVLTKKITIKTIVNCLILIVFSIILYHYGLSHRKTPIIGDLSYRIEDKIKALKIHDYATVTTDRSQLSYLHLNYFMQQGILKQLFGGNLANTYVVKLGDIRAQAHNDYIDSLLNIGIIGSCIMFGYVFKRTWNVIKKYVSDNSKECLFVFLCKCMWLYYLMTLTTFLDFRFMFSLFI